MVCGGGGSSLAFGLKLVAVSVSSRVCFARVLHVRIGAFRPLGIICADGLILESNLLVAS